ncbi:hypothetical protein [Rhodoferax sp.]|uniref:hypothetical protein n=1 Tax=Rhodoferax sp. TaxID=50421 RepID=UPI002747553C|nr:hypothetical protein [Rhodoferax sp.]
MSTPIPSPQSPEPGHILTAEEAKLMAAEQGTLPAREWDGKRLQASIRFGKARFAELYPNPWAMQDAVTVARVESLMDVPYDKLEFDDAMHRQVLGVHRSKETLSSIPFYANRAAKAAADDKEWEYWRSLWSSGVNTMHPPKESSTAEASAPIVEKAQHTTVATKIIHRLI